MGETSSSALPWRIKNGGSEPLIYVTGLAAAAFARYSVLVSGPPSKASRAVFFLLVSGFEPKESQEGPQNTLGILKSAGGQTTSGKGDHGISAPVTEQRVTGQNRLAAGGFPAGNKGIRAPGQLPGNGIRKAAAFFQLSLPLFHL